MRPGYPSPLEGGCRGEGASMRPGRMRPGYFFAEADTSPSILLQ